MLSDNTNSRIRSTFDALWASRRNGATFRNVRTCGFSTSGPGLTWVMLRKFDNTYVLGTRSWWCKANHFRAHPELEAVYSPAQFFSNVWMIAKPDRVHWTARCWDITYDNLIRSWGWPERVQAYLPSCFPWSVRRALRWLGARAYPAIAPTSAFDLGVTTLEDGSYEPIGSEVVEPELQLYDSGLYNRGREQLRRALLYVAMYRRHDIYNSKGNYSLEEGVDKLLSFEEPLSCEELNEWPVNFNYCSNRTWYEQWREFCIRHGVFRIVPAGTPRYTEVPPMKYNVDPDYDQLISADNCVEPVTS